MKQSLLKFAVVLGTCVLLTVLITLFYDRSLPGLINIGSYVGALFLLLGCWRLLHGSNDAIESAHMIQRSQNLEAHHRGLEPLHHQIVPVFLSSGALFMAGLVWLVVLNTFRYSFGVNIG